MRCARPAAIQAASRLREALEQSAAAMAAGQLDALLAGEAALEHALTDLPFPADFPDDERHALRAELDGARAALLRCRRLGGSLTDYVRLTLHAHGRAADYDPQRAAASALGGRSLSMRA
jgi:hypothetical protein